MLNIERKPEIDIGSLQCCISNSIINQNINYTKSKQLCVNSRRNQLQCHPLEEETTFLSSYQLSYYM